MQEPQFQIIPITRHRSPELGNVDVFVILAIIIGLNLIYREYLLGKPVFLFSFGFHSALPSMFGTCLDDVNVAISDLSAVAVSHQPQVKMLFSLDPE